MDRRIWLVQVIESVVAILLSLAFGPAKAIPSAAPTIAIVEGKKPYNAMAKLTDGRDVGLLECEYRGQTLWCAIAWEHRDGADNRWEAVQSMIDYSTIEETKD